jgi:hypothetical protein
MYGDFSLGHHILLTFCPVIALRAMRLSAWNLLASFPCIIIVLLGKLYIK